MGEVNRVRAILLKHVRQIKGALCKQGYKVDVHITDDFPVTLQIVVRKEG